MLSLFFKKSGCEDDVGMLQKRWKQLRDSYTKAKRKDKTYVSSGSAASARNSAKSSFKFYQQMRFLEDVLEKSS